jgi:hypothetical protein
MERLRRDATRVARQFELRYRAIEAESVRSRYGVCYSDGTIRIRLRHATTRRPLKYSSLVNTLCHELAHIRHFNHGPRFRAFYEQLLDWARREDIYRPGASSAARVAHGEAPGPQPGRANPLRPGYVSTAAAAARHPGPVQLDLF